MLDVERLADEVPATKSPVTTAIRGTICQIVQDIAAGFSDGEVVPYLGPDVLTLADQSCRPANLTSPLPAEFADRQVYTEGFSEAFDRGLSPTVLHNHLASLRTLPLVIHDWYDDLPQRAFAVRSCWSKWGIVRGTGRSGRYGLRYLCADGTSEGATIPEITRTWSTLLYQPLGPIMPGASFSGSGGHCVETASAIGGEVPIPEPVQSLAEGRHFLFLGCRFTNESSRMFVRRILQGSSAVHWAVLAEPPTASEARFLMEQNIERIDLPLSNFVAALTDLRRQEKAQLLLASW